MTNELVLGFERPLNRTGSSHDDPEITKKDFSASGEAGEDIFSSPPGFQEMTLHGSGLSAEGDLNFLALAGPHGRDRCKTPPKKKPRTNSKVREVLSRAISWHHIWSRTN